MSTRSGFWIILCLPIFLSVQASPAIEQTLSKQPNARIGELLDMIEMAEPASIAQIELGMELIEAVYQTKFRGIDAQTIEKMATMIETGGGPLRVIVSRALGEIGPPAYRALPALQKAAEVDGEVLKQYYGVAVGPEGPYEAEIEAILRIKGEPERPNPPN
jgi:hypothetical protein